MAYAICLKWAPRSLAHLHIPRGAHFSCHSPRPRLRLAAALEHSGMALPFSGKFPAFATLPPCQQWCFLCVGTAALSLCLHPLLVNFSERLIHIAPHPAPKVLGVPLWGHFVPSFRPAPMQLQFFRFSVGVGVHSTVSLFLRVSHVGP